jgi:hypothetical protein
MIIKILMIFLRLVLEDLRQFIQQVGKILSQNLQLRNSIKFILL